MLSQIVAESPGCYLQSDKPIGEMQLFAGAGDTVLKLTRRNFSQSLNAHSMLVTHSVLLLARLPTRSPPPLLRCC